MPMAFIIEKDPNLIPHVLTKILDSTNNGITLSDPDIADMPIIYANKAFETMTGYSQAETIGRNCRFLQSEDRNQESRFRLREAIDNKKSIEADIRNYKKNGEMFYNHLVLNPLFDDQKQLIYYLGIQYDITAEVEANDEIKRLREKISEITSIK